MPLNGYSIGRDLTLNVVTANGVLQITGLTSFKAKQETTEETIKRLDGVIDRLRFYEGWTGTFMLERRDSTVDRYFCQLESDFFSGLTEGEVTITETITERNGALSQFRYRRVLLKLDDAGAWEGDKSVKRTMSFIASRKLVIT
ncbi:MAG: hypothetical protein ACREUT_20315 [Steroidobacteraceae bacterium]